MQFKSLPFLTLLSSIIDNRGRTCPTASCGIPLIATNCVKNTTLYPTYEKVRHVDDATYRTWFRGHPEPGDLIFVTKGSPGQVCLAPHPVDFCIAQDMVALRVDENQVHPHFLLALLRSASIQREIENMHVGTLIPHFKKGDFDKLVLPIPAMETQRIIGSMYFALSSKIENNRRMNETLEAMAQALFKSWFVDFDPVRAKMEGRQPVGMDAETAALFPDRLIDSEIGEIPEGWGVGTLGDVAEHPRRTVQPGQMDPTTPYIALEHMPRRCIALNDWGFADGLESNKFQFRTGDILFGKLRPYFHKVGVAPVDGVCSTDIVVVTPSKEEWVGVVLGHVSSAEFVEYTNAGSTGTKMPRTSWKEMARYPVVVPPTPLAKAYTSRLQPAVDRILANIHESRSLASARDEILPRLLSGELEVTHVQSD